MRENSSALVYLVGSQSNRETSKILQFRKYNFTELSLLYILISPLYTYIIINNILYTDINKLVNTAIILSISMLSIIYYIH